MRLGAHAMQCIRTLAIKRTRLSPKPWEAWLNRVVGLSRVCIARDIELEKVEEVLLFAITGEGADACPNGLLDPAPNSEASLGAMNTLGNMYQSRGSYAKAAKLYQTLILILQDSQGSLSKWLQDVCENYTMVEQRAKMQEPTLQSPAFISRTEAILMTMRRIEEASIKLKEGRLNEATVLSDELRGHIKLQASDKQSIKLWRNAALCHAQKGSFGTASNIFEEVLSVAGMSRGGLKNSLTLDILNNYGVVCHKRGQLERAEELLGAAEEGLRPRRGLLDGLYLNAVENLGDVLIDRGAYVRAKSIFEICLSEATGQFERRASRIQRQIGEIENHKRHPTAF